MKKVEVFPNPHCITPPPQKKKKKKQTNKQTTKQTNNKKNYRKTATKFLGSEMTPPPSE